MTKRGAESECEQLGRGHCDRHTHQWLPRKAADGGWSVVKVRRPGGDSAQASGVAAAART